MSNRYIGVAVHEDYSIMKVSVLYGLKVIENITYHLNRPDDIYDHLKFLGDLNVAKISYINNHKLIPCLFNRHKMLDLLVDFRDINYYLIPKQPTKGITFTKSLKDVWETYKYLFEYKAEYEESTMIAALNIINNKEFQHKMVKISELKQEIKDIENSL